MHRVCIAVALLATSCAGTHENATRSRLASHPLAAPRDRRPPRFDGTLGAYVAHAVEEHPQMRAAFHRWEAATHRIDQQRRLPDPVISYTGFISRVETRVGPQRHRLGLRQNLPFPTVFTRGAEAASLDAESAGRRVDAMALTLTARVADAYWALWVLEQERKVRRDQGLVLQGLAEAARAKLEIGNASLADVSQVGLLLARNEDALAGITQRRIRREAQLRAVLDVPSGTPLEVGEDAPPVALPRESDEALRIAAADHPAIDSLALAADARDAKADRAFADGLPQLALGFDWIEVGDAVTPVPDSGKDAVSITVGLSIPLWRFAEDAAEDESHAEARALRAERDALVLARRSEIDRVLSRIRDDVRKTRLYRDTLFPQAEAVLEAALAGYPTGDVPLATVVMAQRDLLEIQLAAFEAQADHARAWAVLEHLVGRKVEAREGS